MYDPNERFPIIHASQKRRRLTYFLEWLMMVVCTAVAWLFFVRYVLEELSAAQAMTERMAFRLAVVFALAMGVLLYWQVFNYLLYGKRTRRKGFPEPPAAAAASLYGVAQEALPRLQEAREITLRYEDGRYTLILGPADSIRLGMFDPPRGGAQNEIK